MSCDRFIRLSPKHVIIALLLGAGFYVLGCGDDSPSGPGNQTRNLPSGTVPAFSLVDVNPNSQTHDEPVSPRDYLDKVSAWYFGHAT